MKIFSLFYFSLFYYFSLFFRLCDACNHLCNHSKYELYKTTHNSMYHLEQEIINNIEIMNIELKMYLITTHLLFVDEINEKFMLLNKQHEYRIQIYETLLSSIGLSPAKEDEIYIIEEMEMVAKQKRKETQMRENPFNLH
jgi:hypothetical protein